MKRIRTFQVVVVFDPDHDDSPSADDMAEQLKWGMSDQDGGPGEPGSNPHYGIDSVTVNLQHEVDMEVKS